MSDTYFEAKYYVVRMGPRVVRLTPAGNVLELALEALRRAKRVCPEATLWEQLAFPGTGTREESSTDV